MNKTLLAKRKTALKAAEDLIAKYGDALTPDQEAEVKAAVAGVEEIDAQLADSRRHEYLTAQLKGLHLGDDAQDRDGGAPAAAHSLGDFVVKAAGDTLRRNASGSHDVFSTDEFIGGTKAASDPAASPANLGPWGTDFQRAIVNQRREKLVVADLMGAAQTTLPTIKYLVEKRGADRIAEGGFTTVGEGKQKPYVRYADFDIATESLAKIAGLTKLTDEMIADYGFVSDWINNQLTYDLSVAEEDQLLNGTGTGNNLTGLLNRAGIQTAAADEEGEWADTLYKAITAVSLETPLTADALVINPADYQVLRLSKDGNGQYFGGGFFSGQYGQGGIMVDPPVWGLRTVVSQAVAPGTAVVGAFRQGATVLRKGGVRVDSTNTNDKDFELNLITLRAEERVGLMVPLPAAFVKVDLGTATTDPGTGE